VLRALGLNTYDVLRHDRVLLTRGGLEAVHLRLATSDGAAAAPEPEPGPAPAEPKKPARSRRRKAGEAGA
jgi:hypothetical protein